MGAGLGWGFGAAYGANYLRIAPSFAEPRTSRRANPLQTLQQQLMRLLGRGQNGNGGSGGSASRAAADSKKAVQQ